VGVTFTCTDQYRQFRGYVFAHGNPVTVTDRATIEACLKDPSFKKVETVGRIESLNGDALISKPGDVIYTSGCPKCGKDIRRGKAMHIKHCKGVK
jgi:hypothetical protein